MHKHWLKGWDYLSFVGFLFCPLYGICLVTKIIHGHSFREKKTQQNRTGAAVKNK